MTTETNKTYRALPREEIDALKQRRCRADDWTNVQVAEGFAPDALEDVTFSAPVKLGQVVEVRNVKLHRCIVGDGVVIGNVPGGISNYDIAEGARIQNVDVLATTGESSFGNGVTVEALNEGGGRELKIFDRLSAQLAYLMICYRHRPKLIERLESIIDAYIANVRSDRGEVGRDAHIVNCGTLLNLRIGPAACLDGAARLENGSINSCPEAPARVGTGVIAKDFIIGSGSRVDGQALLTDCFVGQGVQIGRQFSAENSLFFANCEGFHGEACSLFAGPYTVTHHQSTLLIAVLTSFFNAGSGTNQSNHLYKLGPLHQGILDRGSKTGSFSYLLWPCRVGAFTPIIGKHYVNFDSSELPFSYITEEKGKSVLTPAVNLFTVGTQRDGAKWPTRDRRKDPDRLDLIRFEVLSPYTVSKMLLGCRELDRLYKETDRSVEFVDYKGIAVHRLLLKTGRRFYDTAIKKYLGDRLAVRLGEIIQCDPPPESFDALREKLTPMTTAGLARWVDICGMLAPEESVDEFTKKVEENRFDSLDTVERGLKVLHAEYDDAEWAFVMKLWTERLGKALKDLTREDLKAALADGKKSAATFNNMVLKDAAKEFEHTAKIGFGLDGDDTVRDADFTAVRGEYETNKFVIGLREDSQRLAETIDRLNAFMDNLR